MASPLPHVAPHTTRALQRMSVLDRLLPFWIGAAMVAGIALGRMLPGIGSMHSSVEISGVSLPIAVGLLVMMYPVLAKVRYSEVGGFVSRFVGERKKGHTWYENRFLWTGTCRSRRPTYRSSSVGRACLCRALAP